MTLDNMISALQELKGWEGLPYCIEEPMGIEGLGVVTDDLIEKLITLVEFVEELPSNLERCKENVPSVSYDRGLFNGAINIGLNRAISCVDEFVNGLENSKVKEIEAQDAVEYCNSEYEDR